MRAKALLTLRYLVGGGLALLFVLPLWWMFVAALREPGLPPPIAVEWWPRAPHWSNYVTLFHLVPMARYIRNSLLVVGIAVPLTLLLAAPAGFALAQLPPRARRAGVFAHTLLLMIPGTAVWIFRYNLLRWLGLFDTLFALILPAFAGSSPLFVLLFYWAFRHIPDELYESARLDGANAWDILRLIAWPLVKPTTAGVLALTWMLYWGDFTGPVLYVFRPKFYTLAVGLRILHQLPDTDTPLLMAGAMLMTFPAVALFLLLQRFFLHELSLSRLFDKS